MIRTALFASLLCAFTVAPARADDSDSAEDRSIDVAAEQRAGRILLRGWRDNFRAPEWITVEDALWARKQARSARVGEVIGLNFLIVGLASGMLGEVIGLYASGPRAHLGFSISTATCLTIGGTALLAGTSSSRAVHRRWGTGPLWAGRITGIVLLVSAVGAALVAVGGSVYEVATGELSLLPGLGNGFAFILGIPTLCVLAVDFARHQRCLKPIEGWSEEKIRGFDTAARPLSILPTAFAVREGAVLGVVGLW